MYNLFLNISTIGIPTAVAIIISKYNAFRVNQDESNIIGCTNDIYFSLNKSGKIDSNAIDDYENISKFILEYKSKRDNKSIAK